LIRFRCFAAAADSAIDRHAAYADTLRLRFRRFFRPPMMPLRHAIDTLMLIRRLRFDVVSLLLLFFFSYFFAAMHTFAALITAAIFGFRCH